MKILQFSGGLDSLACLLLLRDEPGLVCLSVLTDGVYESTEEFINLLRERFPRVSFVTVRSNRHLKVFGQPADVVPLRWTPMGQYIRGGKDVRYQDSFSCCSRGIWEPLAKASRDMGATVIYRGQRDNDRLQDPVRSGDVVGGVEYRFPIHDWTREQVRHHVAENAPDLLPPGYDEGEKTSRDCWDCTAYLQDNKQRIENLPAMRRHRVHALIARWRDDVLTELGD